MEENCQAGGIKTPETVMMIFHKRTMLMQLLAAMVDPNAFMTGVIASGENDCKSIVDIEKILNESDETLAAFFGRPVEPVSGYMYMEALGFQLDIPARHNFGLNCGRLQQRLTCDF